MQFLIPRQRESLSHWEGRPVAAAVLRGPHSSSYHDHHCRIVAVEAPGAPAPEGPFWRVARCILDYDIFPPALGEGVRRRPVELGDTVGLRYHLLPGLDLFFASRVHQRIDEPFRQGFSYQTLTGHPEVGEETFLVEKDPTTGAVVASLRAWSHLAWPWSLFARRLARPLQFQAGRAALDHLERRAQA